MNPYDEYPYPSQTYPHSHPDNLAFAAMVRGLRAAPPEQCRVLELGCSDGTNLLAIAAAFPGVEAVGVDLAARPVAAGREVAAAAGLRNVRLEVGDASRPDPSWGTFDYVIAHGLYSWVPPAVRDGVLATVRSVLRPDGVAFVSYSAFPGAYVRKMFREMMLLWSEGVPSLSEKAELCEQMLRAVAVSRGTREPHWDNWLAHEAEHLLRYPRALLEHDDLSEVNDPVWFREFVAHAERHGLRYLAEAHVPENSDRVFPAAVRDALATIADPTDREQARDVIRVRRFRQTLLVRAEASPGPVQLGDLARFHATCTLRASASSPALGTDGVETFEGLRGGRVQTDSRILRTAIRFLAERWPRRTPVPEVVAESVARVRAAWGDVSPGDGDALLTEALPALLDAGNVQFHLTSPRIAEVPGPRPAANPLARALAARMPCATSLLQQFIRLDDPRAHRLLPLLDGTRDRAEILAAMRRAEEPPNAPPAGAPPLTEESLEISLTELAAQGFLVA